MDDFWSDLGWGMLIVLGIVVLAGLCFAVYLLWRVWPWVVWIPVVILVVLVVAVMLGHLARDLFNDREHRH